MKKDQVPDAARWFAQEASAVPGQVRRLIDHFQREASNDANERTIGLRLVVDRRTFRPKQIIQLDSTGVSSPALLKRRKP